MNSVFKCFCMFIGIKKILLIFLLMITIFFLMGLMRGSRRGDRGLDPLLKNHKNIGFLSNTGLDPLKNHKATKPD